MTILGIDTSSLACSCAVVRDGVLISEQFLHTGLTHSRTLGGVMRSTLERAGVKPADIDLIAVTNGPGSYTGLRIGVAAAKGFAAAYDIPCVVISTLEALAQNTACRDGVVLSVLDAKVGQFYAALFEVKNGVVTRLSPDDALTPTELFAIVPEGAMAVGDGAVLAAEKLKDKHLTVAPAAVRYQRASSAAYLAEGRDARPAKELAPDYHRKPQAEREREARLKNETHAGEEKQK